MSNKVIIDADDLDKHINKGDEKDLWDITTYDFDDFSNLNRNYTSKKWGQSHISKSNKQRIQIKCDL